MSTMTNEPLPRESCTFYVHGFGLQTLPLLHDLEGAAELLMAGRAADVLMLDGVPVELMDKLKGVGKEDAARFFLMWINAGFDFEAASWSSYMSLHRTLFPQDEEPTPGVNLAHPAEADVIPGEGLEMASALDTYAEHIADKIVEHWRVLR